MAVIPLSWCKCCVPILQFKRIGCEFEVLTCCLVPMNEKGLVFCLGVKSDYFEFPNSDCDVMKVILL